MINKIRISDIINYLPFKKLQEVNTRSKIMSVMEQLGLQIGKEVRVMLHGKEVRVLTIYKKDSRGKNINEVFLFSQDMTSVTFFFENGRLNAFRAVTLTSESMHEISTFFYTEDGGEGLYQLGIDPAKKQELQITINDKNMTTNRYFFRLFRDSWGSIKRFCQVA